MVSLTSHLLQLKLTQQSEQDAARPLSPLAFPAGSQIFSLGHYAINLSAKDEANQHLSLNLCSHEPINCRVYPLKTFQLRAPLFNRGLEGVHHVLEVVKHEDEVFVFSPKPFGDLHDYLKQRRKLEEGLAAGLLRQIVLLVRDAHQKNVISN